MQVKLVHYVCAMRINRLWTDDEAFRNLVIGVTLGNKLENLAFTFCQTAVAILLFAGTYPLQIIPHHDRLSCWREIKLSTLYDTKGCNQFSVSSFFEHIARSAST